VAIGAPAPSPSAGFRSASIPGPAAFTNVGIASCHSRRLCVECIDERDGTQGPPFRDDHEADKGVLVTNVFRLIRAALVAALLVPLNPMASVAGEREVAYLRSLAGTYQGSGRVRGDAEGVLRCRMKLVPSGAKLNITGDCGGIFTGSVVFDERSGRWVYTSDRKSVASRKSGNSLRFTTSDRSRAGSGTTTLTFSPGRISLAFELRGPKRLQASGTVTMRRR
jgi:hypothetical protein